MRPAQVLLDYFPLNGGLDVATPPLTIKPGMCREVQNFEIGVNGGYRTSEGYERADGRPRPSDAVYGIIPVTFSASVSASQTVTGATSGATGVVIATTATGIVITKVTGSFNGTEVINVSGNPVATMTGVLTYSNAATNKLHWEYLNMAADVYRTDIQAVPGAGNILGVWVYDADLYAFRNNVGITEAKMYKATPSGWTLVSTPTLLPNGRYEFVNYNFGAGEMMYGCDGVNKAFQFDGTTFTQITTGMTPDSPTHITAHKNHLFLSFQHSVQHSSIGDPLTWTPVTGAAEINMGGPVTAFAPQPGDANGAAMAIYTRNSTKVLYGNTVDDWKLATFSADSGALPYTAQAFINQTFVLDDRGVTNLQTSQNFGNFDAASISKLIRPYIIKNKNSAVGSGTNKNKNQYRLFFGAGKALYMTMDGGFMPQQFPHEMTCYVSSEDENGVEVSYAGSTNGYVYEFDRGTSHDGENIESYATLVFNHIKSPRTRKFYRKAVLEVQGEGYAEYFLSAELGYGTDDADPISATQGIAALASGAWDTSTWDVGVWDTKILAPAAHELSGTAENISITLAQSSDYMAPLTFHGVMIHYTPRRLSR